jgi:hypothetical protein
MDTIYIKSPMIDTLAIDAIAEKLEVIRPSCLPHITLAFSSAPVEWRNPVFDTRPYPIEIRPENLALDRFGSTVVLKFTHPDILARWQELSDAGAVWDFPTYQPHITLGADPEGDVDLDQEVRLTETFRFAPESRKTLNDDPIPKYLLRLTA